MRYSLPEMAWAEGMRSDTLIKLRTATREHERGLQRVLMPVVDHWSRRQSFFIGDSSETERTHEAGAGVIAAAIAALWRWVGLLDRFQRSQWVRQVKRATGMNVDNMAPFVSSDPDLRAAVQWSVALIRDLNDDMRRRFETVLADATARRLPPAQIERDLARQIKITRRRARLIALDQTRKIAAKMNELQQVAAGIDQYVWQHSFRQNPRKHHVRRQGLRFYWSKPPRDGHPGHAINCRCDAAALLRPRTLREGYLNESL